MTHAGYLFQQVGFKINHTVTPAAIGRGLAGMDLIRVHGDDRFLRGEVVGAAITKALGTGFDSADTKGFMGMGFKGIAGYMGMVKLHAG